VKQKHRYRHKPKGSGLAAAWPDGIVPEAISLRARYVGSGEHKALPVHASYGIEPAAYKRSDASRCDPRITREQAEHVLREAIKLGTSAPSFRTSFRSMSGAELMASPT